MPGESNQRRGESKSFAERVFDVVLKIPCGRVTSYGRIAAYLGAARSARMVGYALHNCPDDVSECAHRVVNRYGELTGGWSWGHPGVMRGLLEDEGVTFVDEYQVDLDRHLWDPAQELETDDVQQSEPDGDEPAYPPPTK